MSKYELIKTIEARKLNKRTGLPTTDPPVTVPYAAILENMVRDRDDYKFTYLGELYICRDSILEPAMRPLKPATLPEMEAAPADTGKAKKPAAEEPDIQWEKLSSSDQSVQRAKVPGGWLVAIGRSENACLTFYPDAKHSWDGKSRR